MKLRFDGELAAGNTIDYSQSSAGHALSGSSRGLFLSFRALHRGVLNQVALAIVAAEKIDAAQRLNAAFAWLEIATEIHPNDANLFATLGDLYQKAGQPAQAVEAYKKALAIDPNFEKAKSALKKQPQ